MLKITSQQAAVKERVSLVLEGRLAGPWVEELKVYCRELPANQQPCTVIDLTGVTFIDAEGKVLLTQLWQRGMELRGSGCLTKSVIESITRGGGLDPSGKIPDVSSSKMALDET